MEEPSNGSLAGARVRRQGAKVGANPPLGAGWTLAQHVLLQTALLTLLTASIVETAVWLAECCRLTVKELTTEAIGAQY